MALQRRPSSMHNESKEDLGSIKDDGASVKDDAASVVVDDWSDSSTQQVSSKDYDPTPDKRDMRRLGKRQELKRRFRFFSIVGYVVVLGLTWEFSLVTSVFSLSNGGPAGAIWLTLFVCAGLSTVMLSMAEIASMAPTAAGQYHWVSEFAPRRFQKPLSFAVGWLTAFSWQCAMPSVAFIGGQQVLALISICDRSFVIQGWHSALLTMAFVGAAIFFNTVAIGKLPILEGLAVVFHFFGFFAFLTIMWIMGPRADAREVFTTFADDNHWGSGGLAMLIAMVGPVATYIGGDSAVHLSEELKDASHVLPRAMIAASVINYVLGFATTVTLMFSLGNAQEDLADLSGQPWVAILYRITGSKPATIILLVVMITMYFFCAVNQVTTSSRQIFAFARDRGLPFSTFLSKVRPHSGVPAHSVYVTLVFACILALIEIGSTSAFNNLLSLGCTGLLTSYIAVLVCVFLKRIRREEFPATKFDLGKAGWVLNALAIAFLTLAMAFIFFPAVPNPNVAEMNWSILIYGVMMLFAVVYYYAKGRKDYDGPVHYVRWQTSIDIIA